MFFFSFLGSFLGLRVGFVWECLGCLQVLVGECFLVLFWEGSDEVLERFLLLISMPLGGWIGDCLP